MRALLMLENGKIFYGESFGAQGEVIGEIVFNTGMTGYQEVITDPSYYGQIVTMTYPLIGNYGINNDDSESYQPQVKGFIVRENCSHPSNWRSQKTLDEYLIKHNIIALSGIDTRALTKLLRENGTMRGIITNNVNFNKEEAVHNILQYNINNAVSHVTTNKIIHYGGVESKIAILDLGYKRNIVNSLLRRWCDVYIFPSNTNYQDILKINPDGIMLTNGPGDPQECVQEIETIKQLAGKIPMFGICLGHQLTALAFGARSTKLKYGHRGCNHPVKDLKKQKTYITSQNHGYTILADSLNNDIMEVSHINMNDNTVEGIQYKNMPLFTVQFHPEASPGPMDTAYLFDEFINMVKQNSSEVK